MGLYKEDLIENKCIESFEVSSESNEKDAEDFWKFVGIFFDKIKNDEVYQSLKDKVAQFRALLAEVENAMRNCDPIVFEKYYQNSKRGFNKAEVVNDFNRELYKNLPITEKKLCVMQAKAVIKAIKSGIFSLDDEVSKDEVLAVRPELETNLVPSNFKITEEFEEAYAIFRRCADKRGIMLVLNYKRYGKYLVDHKKKLTDDHFKAILELDVKLELIHNEMVRWDADLEKYLNQADDTNTFGIVNSLTRLIQQDWFEDFRTDSKYDRAWIEKFVSDLLASEHRHKLLDIWQVANKRLMLKGHIIGCLKSAGVIDGSDLSIAAAIMQGPIIQGNEKEKKTFASYIGRGRKTPFFDWIYEYVNR